MNRKELDQMSTSEIISEIMQINDIVSEINVSKAKLELEELLFIYAKALRPVFKIVTPMTMPTIEDIKKGYFKCNE